MDSYDLFGEDGSGMLEGLTDLGGTDSFPGNTSSAVTSDTREVAESSYRQPYGQGSVPSETSLQKLASYGGTGAGGIASNAQPPPGSGAGPPAEYHDYSAYPPRPRLPQPPHAPHHPPHHTHPSHGYPGYHTGPDPMYSIPEHPAMADMGVWPGAPSSVRGYPPTAPGYRHPYDHQKLHQYPPQQNSAALGLQTIPTGAYMSRQPHFPQPSSQQVYGQQQGYSSYSQIHPPSVPRIGQHAPYHQQMELNSHQYGISHSQQTHSSVPSQHQTHQSMASHQGNIPSQPGLQGHPPVRLHHSGAPSLHHASRQQTLPPSSVAPPTGPQGSYGPPHHTVGMSYQSHTLPHSLDVNIGVANQYGSKLTSLDSGSPQYRAPYPQLSPQMSPRAQMSPRQQAQSQMSPRSSMSPVKGPNASPHHVSRPPAPSSANAGPSTAFNQPNTLQALEQMVLPGNSDYSYQRNPSPAVGHVASPSQWSQTKISTSSNNVIPVDSTEQTSKPVETITSLAMNVDSSKSISTNISLEHDTKLMGLTLSAQGNNPPIDTSKEVINNKPETQLNIFNRPNYEHSSFNEIPKCTIASVGSHINSNDVKSDSEPNKNTSEGGLILEKDKPTVQDEQSSQSTEKLLTPVVNEKIQESNNRGLETPKKLSIDNLVPNQGPQIMSNQGPQIANAPLLEVTSQPLFVQHNSQMQSVASQLNQTTSLNTGSGIENVQTQAMGAINTTNFSVSNIQSSMANTVNQQNVGANSITKLPPTTSTMQTNQAQSLQSNLQATMQSISTVSSMQNSTITSNSSNVQNLPANLPIAPTSNLPITPATNLLNNASPSIASANAQPVPTTVSTPVTSLPSNITGIANTPTKISNIQTSMQNTTNMSIQTNMPINLPINIQSMHSNISSNQTNLSSNIQHSVNPNMNLMISPNVVPLPNALYQSMTHHQERAALQQQIQEIYCMPPSVDLQEKLRKLQERLSTLQQHETNDNCTGGNNCLLPSSLYSSTMVESPQVSSTTGRGRVKGPARPRKPRAKKDKTATVPSKSLDQLPVSEDRVTAGTGLQITNLEMETDLNEEIINLDGSGLLKDGKSKKPRAPRKPRERKPRVPKPPKSEKDEKPFKERKKREPKDPNAPKRKRCPKKDNSEIQADTTTSNELCEKEEKNNSTATNTADLKISKTDPTIKLEHTMTEDIAVTDFDDIPVSKIAIKDLLEEAEAKKENENNEDDTDSTNNSPLKKKQPKKRSIGVNKKSSGKKVSIGKKKKRGGIVPESDGEPDDMMSTPPPSPPLEGDCDSSKRRSARHTQRKKYTDDVILRLSDDEYSLITVPKPEKEVSEENKSDIIKESVKPDITPKPNYIYVNTTEEDSMIVQHILACRIGKRELKDSAPVIEIGNKEDSLEANNQVSIIQPANDTSFQSVNLNVQNNKVQDENVPSEHMNTDEKEHKNLTPPQLMNINEYKGSEKNDEPDKKPDLEHCKVRIKEDELKNRKPVMIDIEEYFVKYRNFSYLHCEWKTEEELYKGDKRIFSKIKRFKQKQSQQVNIFELFDEEPFNPDYVEVERILDVSETTDPANNTVAKHYLVKWKSLQYEDSTWELEEDVDIDKIKQFELFSAIPPKEKWKFKRRPSADQWTQLEDSPVYKGGNTLRPYQLEGLNWLLFSWHNNRNCILADEMGLGKTIQSLTFVNSVWEYGIRGPFLIIAPLSTIPNWQREFEAWTDMNVIVYHGSQQSKSMIQEYEFYYKNEDGTPIKDVIKFNVLITTFEIIVTDFQDLKNFNWRICVIDEAHRLKNRNCKLLEGLRQLHLEHRVLLSGTPLQNNVNELFSLLNFLEPSQFASSDAFLTEFGQLKSESEVIKLQALLKPMMLRRLKEDVEKTLAPKEETIIEVELTNIQKKYYRAILERNFSFLCKGTASAANIPNLMNTMMELRKCCIHPYLLNGAEDQIQFDYKQTYGEDNQVYYKALIQSSGKMVLVDKLLPKLKAGGHRVLIFSQMVKCLDILEDYLMYRKYPYERIDGRIRGNLRQEAIDRFSKPDSDRFVFLLCTKAGGLGINLTAADTVIIYDSDWNPQNDLQAQARCHRIGQQKMVKIYRLICRNTYEREMFDKASLKLGLDKAVLQSMNTGQGKETGVRQLSKKEIEDLLRKGAYGAVMDEDNAGDKFCEEDIEMILARRTQVIQMESEKGSTFSKASFAATDQRSDIDIRDPDFWNKWAKKAEIDTTEKREDEDLIVTEPRRRTLIKRYGQDDGTVEMSDMEETPDSDEDLEGIGLRSKKKKDRFGKKSKKYMSDDYIPRHEGVPVDEDVVYGMWARSECFKIERGLLTFGWGRWDEIFDKNQFRRGWTNSVIEDCARVIILYCLRHYKGDEKIRNFIWDLIEPCENGEVTISRNHSGLHNPVPRGRNAKKKNKPKDVPKLNAPQKWEDQNHWSSAEKYDCEAYLESSYKKHLFRHANKVLLRVRMMYYIKHEVIGDYAQKIDSGVHASALGMRVPRAVDSAPPRMWWDADCDVSLLVGTYIHGYENYLAMRSDPQLCFVDKLGPPDDAECTDIKSEERSVRSAVGGDEDCTDDVSSGAGATSPAASPRPDDDSTQGSSSGHPWPSMQDLNTRLRRLITAYQRNYKKEELKMQQRAKMERRERMEQLARDEAAQWRWTRADEEAFRRTVASYGVEFDPTTKSLRWGRFRALARLDTKSDDALTDYLKAFMAMCKRQCGLSVGEAELPTRADLRAEPIGEERAIATLERIDLLRVLREEVAPHPALDARLALCERSPDTPPWWQPARHDKLLVLGVCKHGLGDTYHKLFCDPKLPFADCARKWTESSKSFSRKESQKMSSDDEREIKENLEDSLSDARTLRRSKRNSNNCSQDVLDDDTDALSELETLAKLGRTDESPPPHHWFSERALETRLHHIAHAVQNCEWPTVSKPQRNAEPSAAAQVESREERKRAQKQHIAIDVETDRAKLHALLSSPNTVNAHAGRDRASTSRSQSDVLESCAASMSKTSNVNWERDDASSESSSRRSTPAPPPAHQRHTHTPAPAPSPSPSASSSSAVVHSAAPVDLSAPLDLSEAHDFSLGRRTPASELNTATLNPPTLAPPSKGRLDDTLSKLMKRKNVPEPEVIVGKEKKRKKLDEIVLGLSAAKGHFPPSNSAAIEPLRNKPTTVLPNVTVTPAALPNSSIASPAQKPFSVTVTSVPSPQATPKELSSFLQQTLEQTSQQKAPKTSSSGVKPYSHEAKVNKWLAEQANVERRRALTPRLSPDEHVPVVHRVTGKRLAGHKAPQLKHLAQWIAENPMYDIDSKWTEGVKEHVKLPQDVRAQRHSPMQPSSSTSERKKGRPPTLDASSASILSSASNFPHLSQSLAGLNPALLASLSGLSAFDPKTLASTLSNLTGFDPKTLNSFDPKLLSSLGSFDPKNNPLLTSFTSMPNMLGNMNSGNLFANLASLGIPGFSGVDMANLGVAPSSDTKSKSRKPTDTASSSNKSSPSQFPFVFPNPNMLYPQLGLSGLNPFGMQTGISSAYDALGLLSNSLATSSSATTTHSVSHTAARSSSKATLPRPTSMTSASTSGLSRQPKNTSDRSQTSAQLHQLLLPPDTYLLESLSKQNLSYDPLKSDKRTRDAENHDVVAADLSSKSDKKKMPFEAPRAQLPIEFAAVQEKLLKGDKRDLDISKMLFEQMASGALSASLVSSSEAKKLKENEGKGAFEKLNKTSAEYISRSLVSDDCMSGISMAHKRTHDEITNEPENLVIQPLDSSVMKKLKENEESDSAVALNNIEKQTDTHTHSGEMDLEDLIAPSTVIKTGLKSNNEVDKTQNVLKSQAVPAEREQKSVSPTTNLEDEQQPSKNDDLNSTNDSEQKKGDYKELTQESIDDTNVSSEEISEINDGGRRTSKKKARKSTEDNPGGGARRELRSSAGRQAAAAAARHALNH